jgi:hypothetical protein
MDQIPHVDDLPKPIPAPQPAAADDSGEAAGEGSSSSSGQAVLQHPVWLALDEVVDPVSGGQPCRGVVCLCHPCVSFSCSSPVVFCMVLLMVMHLVAWFLIGQGKCVASGKATLQHHKQHCLVHCLVRCNARLVAPVCHPHALPCAWQ